jgi:murein DD-endopeptidase MepM/ murein hydrolase activator NlpD
MTTAHLRPRARRPAAAASALALALSALPALPSLPGLPGLSAALGAAAVAASAAAAAATAASPLAAETLFTGVFSRGDDAYQLLALPDWRELQKKARQARKQGLRVVALRTYLEGGRRFYAGAWREGAGDEELAAGLDAAGFLARNRELAKRGLQLVDLDTYAEGRQRKFLGVWRGGRKQEEVALELDGPALASADERQAARGLRPLRLRAYRDRGHLRFLALWQPGEGDHHLLTGLDGPRLVRTQAELSRGGLQLVDVDAYDDDRGRRRHAGIWRAGASPASVWTGEWESFVARWHELARKGERLIALAAAPGACRDECVNQVVARQAYDYAIHATATHCEGPPGTCAAPPGQRHPVVYHWPVESDGASRFIRLSALEVHDAPFTLPFSDTAVKRRGVWLYGAGSWHHAADFSRDDQQTFAARAAAPGTVIFVGWDPWSGNTVIVSHDAGGSADAYRTIYMHLRDGASHDCEAAWSQTLAHPPAAEKELAPYRVHLLASGCAQGPASRRPDPGHWGTEAQTIDHGLVGKQVAAGQFLAWAGDTGPGGKRGPGAPNTHLHVFFAHRDPADQHWYLFDPYGIYGQPACYPQHLTDSIAGPCVRYPVAWAGGRPRFP